MSKSLLIFGATGKQGSAVVRSLVGHPNFSPTEYTILGVTRNPDSAGAQRLARLSPAVKLVKGDLSPATFQNLPASPYGVYTMTTVGKNESQQGIAIAEAAANAGVHRFVFSSVDRGEANDRFTPSDVPHFITKHQIEARIYELAKERDSFTYTIIRPPFFINNLEPGILGRMMATMWRDHCTREMSVVDTRDIGKFAAAAFLEPDNPHYRNQSINIAGDRLTFAELDEKFKAKTGAPVPTTYSFLSNLLLFLSSDVAKMTKFFQEQGFAGKPEESNQLQPMTDVSQWLDTTQHVKKDK